MEPHINHGPPSGLGTRLQGHGQRGLGVPEAECLSRRMFYSFDGIPMALRHQLSRITLTSTFAELAHRCWVRIAHVAAGNDLLTPQYWQQLLTPNYRRSGPIHDCALGEAVFHRLEPGLG